MQCIYIKVTNHILSDFYILFLWNTLNILEIGYNTYILSNAIDTASSSMSIDVEVRITKYIFIFIHFIVWIANFKQFCEEDDIEIKSFYTIQKWGGLL